MENIVINNKIASFLQGAVRKDSLGHAYLFSGAKDLGKRRTARNFISEILSISTFDYANQNLRWIGVDEDRKEILLSQVKEIQQFLSLTSFEDSYRVVVIDQAEKMNKEAMNCLLKTLEEPSQKAILILIAESQDKLLETIISRCQVYNFYPNSTQEILETLRNNFADKDEESLKKIASSSHGKIEIAWQMVEDKIFFEKYQRENKEILEFLSNDLNWRLNWVDNKIKDKEFNVSKKELETFLNRFSIVLHQILNANIDNAGNLKRIRRIFEAIKSSQEKLNSNTHPKLILRNLSLNI